MEKQKRERSVNFSHEETDLLVSLAQAKKNIIENKKSDATTWQSKEKAWKDIETAFNSTSGSGFRDRKHLKVKYEAMKRDTRKKSAVIRAERYRTGGGTIAAPVLTPSEQKVKEMILLSVEGNESFFDSDLELPGSSTSSSIITFVLAEEQNVQPAVEPTLRDDSSNIIIEIREQDIEPPRKKVCEVPGDGEALQCESDFANQSENQHQRWKEWNPTALKTKKHPVLSKPKEKRPFEKLTEDKIEIAKIQKQILNEEMEQKLIQRKILDNELVHKDAIHELEKQHLLLKIEILKRDLGQK